MNRTFILLLLFIGLGTGAYFLLTKDDQISTTSNPDEGNFAVKNLDDIQKIFIADGKGYEVLLERQKGFWLYNKQFKAKPSAIGDLLTTIRNVQMKYTTPRGAEAPMLRNLSTTGIKVEIIGKDNKKLKTYYVGGATANSLGTYMILEGAKEPFVVHDPTFQGMLRGKYLKQPDDWKDLTLFGESVEEIQSVSVEYPKQKNKSFKINRMENDEYEVTPFYESTPAATKPQLKGAVEKYLTGYSVLHAEAFENNLPTRDSISSSLPFVILSVTNTEGETKIGKLFPIINKDEYGNPINYINTDMQSKDAIARYFLDYNDGSFRLVQHRVFERVFWGYKYFFQT